MTEEQWLKCEEPTTMVLFLGRRNTQRKLRLRSVERRLRLFAVACCRSIWPLIGSDQCRNGILVAERFADVQATSEELQAAEVQANASWLTSAGDDVSFACMQVCSKDMVGRVVNPVCHVSTRVISAVFTQQQTAAKKRGDPLEGFRTGACPLEEHKHCQLLHCIFGNPFRAVTLNPKWLTSTVVALARGIYEDRAFDRLPILADALMDAGCNNEEILAHCRSEGPHCRGCWVVDLVLNKA